MLNQIPPILFDISWVKSSSIIFAYMSHNSNQLESIWYK